MDHSLLIVTLFFSGLPPLTGLGSSGVDDLYLQRVHKASGEIVMHIFTFLQSIFRVCIKTVKIVEAVTHLREFCP